MTRLEFLKQNDKRFAELLATLRRNLYVPRRQEDFDGAYKLAVRQATRDYSERYHDTMASQLDASASRITAAPAKAALAFLLTAAAVGGLTDAVARAGNPIEGIAAKVASDAMFAELPSGYTLSGRIWDLGTYSEDILQLVNNGFINNLNPEILARQLDGFVLADRQVTTLTPYGRALNFDSMRLARTEIIHAERAATKAAMDAAPWVTGLYWDGSDGCEEFCQPLNGNIYTSEDELPDPHPQCNCPVVEQVLSADEWAGALEQYLEDGTDELGIAEWLGE
jgi:hypothetical protein